MQLCAITARKQLTTAPNGVSAGEAAELALRRRLGDLVEAWSRGGVHFIQLREKDLDAPALQSLAQEVISPMDRRHSKLLINVAAAGSAPVALRAGADGVHIPGKPTPGAAQHVRQIFRAGGREAIVSMACHSLEDIEEAKKEQADFVLFSPIFEKQAANPQGPLEEDLRPAGQGIRALRRACAAADGMPVLALGGITAANALECVSAGAAGVAGIRLFAGNEWRRLTATQP